MSQTKIKMAQLKKLRGLVSSVAFERNELNGRIRRLEEFVEKNKPKKQVLLERQLIAMGEYRDILNERLTRFQSDVFVLLDEIDLQKIDDEGVE